MDNEYSDDNWECPVCHTNTNTQGQLFSGNRAVALHVAGKILFGDSIHKSWALGKIGAGIRGTIATKSINALADVLEWYVSEENRIRRQMVEEKISDSDVILRKLETSLRKFIEMQMSNITPDWWERLVPGEIRKSSENKKRRRETVWPWYPPTSRSLTDYLDFSDYKKIILDPDNWESIYKRFFGTKSFIETRLEELEPVRNDLAHSRQISTTAKNKLKLFSEEIQNCLNRQH